MSQRGETESRVSVMDKMQERGKVTERGRAGIEESFIWPGGADLKNYGSYDNTRQLGQ